MISILSEGNQNYKYRTQIYILPQILLPYWQGPLNTQQNFLFCPHTPIRILPVSTHLSYYEQINTPARETYDHQNIFLFPKSLSLFPLLVVSFLEESLWDLQMHKAVGNHLPLSHSLVEPSQYFWKKSLQISLFSVFQEGIQSISYEEKNLKIYKQETSKNHVLSMIHFILHNFLILYMELKSFL